MKSSKTFEYKPLLLLIVIFLIILSPSLLKIYHIKELYLSKDIRGAVVDGMFFIRDRTGYALADMRIVDIVQSGSTLHLVYIYNYMGNIDRREYDDVNEWIFVDYDLVAKEKKIVGVSK
jgi:hypothetical protein